MRNHSKNRIEKKSRETWPDAETVEVSTHTPTLVRVRVASMYTAPGLSFPALFELAEFMGTKNIHDEGRINDPGCETCDYGSSYGFTLVFKPETAHADPE